MRLTLLLILCSLPFGCTPNQSNSPMSGTDTSTLEHPLDIQGHRGARGLLPENTIPSFLRALELGVTTLEMDVVISKDNEVILSHEPWFSHTICSKPDGSAITEGEEKELNMYQLTTEEISQYDCGSIGNERFPQQQPLGVSKPTLRQVISEVEAAIRQHSYTEVFYNIETKSSPERDGIYHPAPAEFTRLVHDVITEMGISSRTTLQSFDVRTLQEARKLAPDLQLALLVGSHNTMDFEGQLENLGFTPSIYSPYYKLVDQTLVTAVHKAGMQIIPWTINTREEMESLVALGVDGIITDYPNIGIQLLKKEGS